MSLAGSDPRFVSQVKPVLARLFSALFRAGLFPPAWALGAITSILKKGDPTEPNNYRGITVGHVLGKLYALVINARLSAWLEDRGKRAAGQGSFARRWHRGCRVMLFGAWPHLLSLARRRAQRRPPWPTPC